MNKQLKMENLKDLLSLLEQDKINEDEFYELIEQDNEKISIIIKVLRLCELQENDLLIKQLLSCKEYHLISRILMKYKKIRDNVEKRNFVVENETSPRIEPIAKLIEYDFIFQDKELLKTILETDYSNYLYFEGAIQILYEKIKKDPEFYIDGSKNIYLRQGFKIENCKDVRDYVNLMEVINKFKNPKWYTYLSESCNLVEDFDLEAIIYSLPDILAANRKEQVNNCLLELDKKEIQKQEKLEQFNIFVSNLEMLDYYTLTNDTKFSYSIKHIFKPKEEFETHYYHTELFIDESSPCKEGSKLYQAIFSISNNDIRDEICSAFGTSLRDFITIEFIKEQEHCNLPEVYKNLKELAIKYNAIDYIKKYEPSYLTEYVTKEFTEYMEKNPKLTKEELLKLKSNLEKENTTIDDKPVFQNKLQTIKTPEDDTLKGKIRKIGQKIFSK